MKSRFELAVDILVEMEKRGLEVHTLIVRDQKGMAGMVTVSMSRETIEVIANVVAKITSNQNPDQTEVIKT